MVKSKNNKTLLTAGYAMLLVGLAGLSYPILTLGFLGDFAFLNEVEGDYGYSSQSSTLGPFVGPENGLSSTPRPTPTPTPTDYEAKEIRNRLIIERAGINMALIVSEHGRALFKGGWVFTNSPTPETGDNMIIFGHRFRYLPPVSNTLYNLDKIKIGDEFKIVWNGKEYKYKTIETKIIEPNDLSVLNHSEKAIVTIITCSPLFSSDQRLVIIAEQI